MTSQNASLTVNEIFYSIQGESLFTGLPCVFIRLTGCNLRCSYCDTRYAYDGGQKMRISQVLSQIASYDCRLVAITGGEPLLQAYTPFLIDTLLTSGYTVLLETNGSFDIRRVDARCCRILDIKCPSSGESHRNDWGNLNRLTPQDQVKFVIGNRTDFEFAKEIVPRISRIPGGNILFSSAAGQLTPDVLAGWILEDQLTVRLQTQLHKILWPDIERGV